MNTIGIKALGCCPAHAKLLPRLRERLARRRVGAGHLPNSVSLHWRGIAAALLWLAQGQAAAQQKLDLVTHDFPPYSFEGSDGVLQGNTVELITRICKQAGLICDFRLLPFRRAGAELAEGLAMGHFPLGWNRERMEKMHFSVPLQNIEYGFFVIKGSPLMAPWPVSLSGKRVGVVGPSNTEKVLRQVQAEQDRAGVPQLSVHLIATETGQCAQMLSDGRLDACFANRETLNHFVKKLALKAVIYGGKVSEGSYVIGFNKDKTPLATVQKFNRAAIELLSSKGLTDIYKHWDASVPAVELAAWDKMGMPR